MDGSNHPQGSSWHSSALPEYSNEFQFDFDHGEQQHSEHEEQTTAANSSSTSLASYSSTSPAIVDAQASPAFAHRQGMLQRHTSTLSERSAVNARLKKKSENQKRAPLTVWLIVATAAMTYTLHGFSNSITNGIITNKTFLHQFPEIDTVHAVGSREEHDSTLQGVTIGLYQVGCAAGAAACYFLTDRIGRKWVIHLLGILNCVGIIIQVTAFTLPHLIVGRVVMGVGVGAGHATFPLYLAECVNSGIRGRAIIACAAAGNFGHFVGAAAEVGFYFVKSSAQWRVPIALELVWALGSAILPIWCPESPRFLLRKGRYQTCIQSLSKLLCEPEDSPEVLEEIKILEEALHEAGADEIITTKKPPRRFYRAGLAIFIQIMSSMSGIDVVSFFSTQTFQSQLKFSPLVSRYLTMGLQACQWLFSTLSIFLIDSMGRRPLLLSCAALMTVAMGFLFGLTIPTATESMLKAAILFYFFTMCAYPVGYHLIPSMYTAELSPGVMRHQICSFSGCLHFLFDFTVTLVTPVAFSSIHSRYYIVYAVFNAFTFIVVYLFFLETKGLELETIDEIFEAAPTYIAVVRYGQRFAKNQRDLKGNTSYGKSKGKGKGRSKAKGKWKV